MKYLLMILLIYLGFLTRAQTTQTTDQIRQQMAKIRQTTNWDDPVAAQKANEEIKALSKKMMMSGSSQGSSSNQQQQQGSANKPNDAQKLNEMNEEMVDQKLDLMSQIAKSAAGGKGADILLAEPLREEIKREYKEDEAIKSKEYFETTDVLILDLSMPGVENIIAVMENFQGIKTLAIYCEKTTVSISLSQILNKAKSYPLNELHIFNFENQVTVIPSQVFRFKELTLLSLFNNKISEIPGDISQLKKLRTLYLDMNPLETLLPMASSLQQLEILGIAKTRISTEEVGLLQKSLPKCQILIQ